MALGTNENLYLLVLTAGNLERDLEGNNWNSGWRGWPFADKIDSAFLWTNLKQQNQYHIRTSIAAWPVLIQQYYQTSTTASTPYLHGCVCVRLCVCSHTVQYHTVSNTNMFWWRVFLWLGWSNSEPFSRSHYRPPWLRSTCRQTLPAPLMPCLHSESELLSIQRVEQGSDTAIGSGVRFPQG